MVKWGRFAFLLPYIVLPPFISSLYNISLLQAALINYLLPLTIEPYILILYPICWIISIACYIEHENMLRSSKLNIIYEYMCGKSIGYQSFVIIWTVIHIICIVV